MRAPLTISAIDARRLFITAQELGGTQSQSSKVTLAALANLIERIGFVQVDTINVLDRAHHLILASRCDGYRHSMLDALLGEKHRKLFEHWTHDASLIPTKWFAHWRPRFARYQEDDWYRGQIGANPEPVIDHVLDRIRREGPLMSKDFEHAGPKGTWWNWKPQKAALHHLWRTGALYIVGRKNFHKVYDLTERAVPHLHAIPDVDAAEHVGWACRTALERLGTASAKEVADFWRSIRAEPALLWLRQAVQRGEVIEVLVESLDGSPPRNAFAFHDVMRRIKALNDSNGDVRLLAPFDPIVRDRARALRLFNFDYRFEAYVPKPQRKHGYYVMPILEGDRLIGRLDPKFHRDRNVLEIRFIQLEKGIRADRARKARVNDAIERLARFVGADSIEMSARL